MNERSPDDRSKLLKIARNWLEVAQNCSMPLEAAQMAQNGGAGGGFNAGSLAPRTFWGEKNNIIATVREWGSNILNNMNVTLKQPP